MKEAHQAEDQKSAPGDLDTSFTGGAGKIQSDAVKVESALQSLPPAQTGTVQDAADGQFKPYTPPPKPDRARRPALPGSDLVEFSAPRKLSKGQEMLAVPLAPVSTFTIVIVPGPGLTANPAALAAFEAAADAWEARFTDPITVIVNADIASLGPGIIGSASAPALSAGYNTIRNSMVADANSSASVSDNIATSLPTATQFAGSLPVGFGFNGNIFATKANLKALGFTGLDAIAGTPSDGNIIFSSNFSFDYDRSDGVSAGQIDFQTVATHEIGHLLGFTSVVDEIDSVLPGTSSSIEPTPLDLFRFSSSDVPTTPATFTTAARSFVPGHIAVTSDTVTSQLMSTGVGSGDGRQASHWKDDLLTSVLIGIMDPTLSSAAVIDVNETDRHTFDLIGYDVVPNTAPVASASPNPAATGEDTAIQITLTGSDVEDDNLTFTVTDAPDHGSLGTVSVPDCSATNSCTATVTYTPNPTFHGADFFKFKVNDGTADSAEETLNITVNAPPTITAASGLSRQKGSAANSQIAAVTDDGGNGNVGVTITSANPSNGVTISNIVNTGGNVTADIVANCSASNVSFTLQASDGALTATATLNITVTANTAPTLSYTNPPALAFKGSTTVTPAAAGDNGSITGYSVQSVAPALTTAPTVNSSGVVSITNAQPAGTHTITIRATDNCGAISDASFTLTVNKGDQTITFGALANKTFGDPDFSVSATATSGLAVSLAASGQCTVTSSSPGSVHLTGAGACIITATQAGDSNYNAAAEVSRSLTVTEVNQAPIANNDTFSNVAEDSGPRTISFTALTTNDAAGPAHESGQTLIVKTVSNPVGGTVSIAGGNVLFIPAADYNGPASFDYTVEDNGTTNGQPAPLSSGIATASFIITEVNDAPVAEDNPLGNLEEDAPQRTIPFSVLTGNDSKGPANESGQTLIVKTVSNPVGLTVSIVAGTVRFTPLPNYKGPANFKYTVEDNGTTNGLINPKTSAPALVHFNITEVNDVPTGVNDTLTNVAEDSGQRTIPFATLTANDSKGPADESSQTLIVKTVGNAVGGTVSIVEGNVQFTPTPNYFGPASFDYTVEDNGTTNAVADPKTSGPATVSFNIAAAADTPSVTNATTNANTQTTSGLVISRNPLDGVEVTDFKITGITGGVLFKNNGTTPINNGDLITFAEGNAGLKFTPGTTNGSFTVQASTSASDAGVNGGTATATITVNALGGILRFSAANYSVAEGAGFRTITVERSGDTTQAVTVNYASTDHSSEAEFVPCTSAGAGFASSRCDFTTAIGTLKFAAGETSKTFNVQINQDSYVEGTERLELTLSNASGAAVFGVPQRSILSITDDVTEPATNPIDTSSEFVRAQYHDILGREPEAAGLAFWTDNIEKCNDPARRPAGQTVAQCIDKQREATAIAFFMSPEFQITGGYVFHLYKGSLTGSPNYDGGSPGRFPTFLEFMHDKSQVSEGIVVNNQISGAVVEANRNALAAEFVQRPEFVAKYGGLNHELYVQELFNTTGITPTAAEKQALVDGLGNGTETRASVLRKVVDGTVVIDEGNVQFTTTYGQAFINQENNRLFVYLEYVGYLRRNPDPAGFVFWLGKLNSFNGDPFQAEMVRSFILAPEYRSRSGQP
jgi:hypothetical protein